MSSPPPTPPAGKGHQRRWRIAALVLAVVVVLVVVAGQIDLNEYLISPGDAQPVGPLVHVPPARSRPLDGPILLTDVYVQRASLLDLIPYLFSSDEQLVSKQELLGPYTPPAELVAQGYLEMAQAQTAAKAAALRRLGYAVPEHNAGALVFAVAAGSPAAGVLNVAQVITAVGTTATPTACAFVGALAGDPPGARVTLTVERSTVTSAGVIEPGKSTTETVTLRRRPPGDSGATGCPGVPASKSYLGVAVETQQHFTLPFPISIDTSGIGGPSAGLAMTLGIIDRLTNGRLTGGHIVAATGTMSAGGVVGAVGGVPQKTIAVERAGATAFLVPPQNYRQALSKASSSLHVYKVSTLVQALSVLEGLGGKIPPSLPPGSRGS